MTSRMRRRKAAKKARKGTVGPLPTYPMKFRSAGHQKMAASTDRAISRAISQRRRLAGGTKTTGDSCKDAGDCGPLEICKSGSCEMVR
jgi:hypothetical protein